MRARITNAEAKAFRDRWEAVNAAEREELLKTPIRHKLLQLAALMATAEKMGWTETLAKEETEVRDRWNRLRKVLGDLEGILKRRQGKKRKKSNHSQVAEKASVHPSTRSGRTEQVLKTLTNFRSAEALEA